MKRYIGFATVLVTTFVVGVSLFYVTQMIGGFGDRAPLQVKLAHASSGDSLTLMVTVKNVSDKVIRGYSLGHTCNCRSWDSYDRPYPPGTSFTNPAPEHQRLLPGESQQFTMEVAKVDYSRENKAPVWVDLVHFEGGANWGPNAGRKEGYVRE